MAEKPVEKPKLKLKDYEFTISDDYLALCLVLQDLTKELERVRLR